MRVGPRAALDVVGMGPIKKGRALDGERPDVARGFPERVQAVPANGCATRKERLGVSNCGANAAMPL